MTTLHPPPGGDPIPPVAATPPVDPRPNKAVATAVTTLVTVGVQWAVSGDFTLDDEGITALGGALATVLVYAVSNWKPRGF